MDITILIIFCVGYLLITLEQAVNVNKSATALVTGVLCWSVYVIHSDAHGVVHQLMEQLGDISGLLFFIMGAMTIVSLIDAHDGFDLINNAITTSSNRKLLWIVSLFTFFLSAVLDNLTTAIVMVTILTKLIPNKQQRLLFIGMVIIAANAGGAWSPIGDVTTTLLWIDGRISTMSIINRLFFPSVVSLIVPLTVVTFMTKGKLDISKIKNGIDSSSTASKREQQLILFAGIIILLFVPIFKLLTNLPPFMGMLLGLGLLWIFAELLHRTKKEEEKHRLSIVHALKKMDIPSILFFLGILLAVGALQSTGQFQVLAKGMTASIGNENMILTLIGIASAIVDNVPIVAATIAMYPLEIYPMDHSFWLLLSFCAGTGGSLLIIGSAAGVAAMGIQKISFGWYVRHIAWLALLGYVSGIGIFIIQEILFRKI